MKLPRQPNGRLDRPRWTCDHQTSLEIYAESGQNLERIADECINLGLDPGDKQDMLENWSWTWICATLWFMRTLVAAREADERLGYAEWPDSSENDQWIEGWTFGS